MNLLKATASATAVVIAVAIDTLIELVDSLADLVRRTLTVIRAALHLPDDPDTDDAEADEAASTTSATGPSNSRTWVPFQVTQLNLGDIVRINNCDYEIVSQPQHRNDPDSDTPWDTSNPDIVDIHLRYLGSGEELLLSFAAQTRLLTSPNMAVPDDLGELSGPGAEHGAAA